MVRIHRTLKAVALGIAIVSSPAMAQSTSSTSLVHTVSVTVPPRVQVQLGTAPMSTAFATRAVASSTTRGLAVTVAATRGWVLSSGNATIASGGLASEPRSAQVIVPERTGAVSSRANSVEAPLVLTIAAP